jgi:hypothetical protein
MCRTIVNRCMFGSEGTGRFLTWLINFITKCCSISHSGAYSWRPIWIGWGCNKKRSSLKCLAVLMRNMRASKGVSLIIETYMRCTKILKSPTYNLTLLLNILSIFLWIWTSLKSSLKIFSPEFKNSDPSLLSHDYNSIYVKDD